LSPIIVAALLLSLILELRPLRSTGITRLQRYYEPLRHRRDRTWPSRVVRCGLPAAVHVGFPCFLCVPLMHAVLFTPADRRGAFVADLPSSHWPSLPECKVGIHIEFFEASSSFHLRYGLHHRGITNT
jgi:hypothetical protein